MKLSQQVTVKNALGLHARPAAVIVKLLQGTRSKVWFIYKQETVNARSIMGILMLAVTQHAIITIEVEGVDADEIMHRLMEAFDNRFGE